MISNRWQQLNVREKCFVGLGGALVLIVILFFYVWSPLQESAARLSSQVQQQQTLLKWMEGVSTRVETLQAEGFSVSQGDGSVTSLLDKELSVAGLSRFVSSKKSINANLVSTSFNQVPFDKLMTVVTTLWKKHDVDVQQFSVKITPTIGMVSAELTFLRSK